MPTDNSANELADLKSQFRSLTFCVRIFLALLLLVLAALNIRICLMAPQFEMIFADMLSGTSMPAITRFTLDNSRVFLATTILLLLGGLAALFFRGNKPSTLGAAGALALFFFVEWQFLTAAMFQPVIKIIMTLGQNASDS